MTEGTTMILSADASGRHSKTSFLFSSDCIFLSSQSHVL